ncbi:hypothetical protein HF394_11025 [Planococcus glaciei]|uniref:GPI inositol-deacylase transmembrane domain-containing protein n=1 Tax=Planococcus glaciei TaxID=459472 RepID=A0A7H8QCI4_9BACL|nr:hypothetical protein [Planococcus glaciei]QKX51075.1 hypothetical protein HF394_11025 [Planococcus glaciei]
MEMLLIWFVLAFGFSFLKSFLKKRFAIEQEERSGIPVRRFERWTAAVMVIAITMLILFFVDVPETFFFWVFIVFLTVNTAQVFSKWKLLESSRKYQMSFVYFTVTALALLVFIATIRWQIG